MPSGAGSLRVFIHDGTLLDIVSLWGSSLCSAHIVEPWPSTSAHAGPPHFIFEKAKYNGVVSAQLEAGERQGGSGACLIKLADDLRGEDSCRDINIYNHRLCSQDVESSWHPFVRHISKMRRVGGLNWSDGEAGPPA